MFCKLCAILFATACAIGNMCERAFAPSAFAISTINSFISALHIRCVPSPKTHDVLGEFIHRKKNLQPVFIPDLSAEYDVDEHIIAFFPSMKTSSTHDQTSVDYVGLLQTTALLPRPHSEMDTYVL